LATWIQTENFPISLPALFASLSPEETFSAGKNLAPLLTKGSIVALKGPLGAGKTCFAKGIARGLSVEEEITSPTYTIVSEYEAFTFAGDPAVLYHIDAYRLKGSDDFSAIGGEDILFADGISLIEWSERIEDFIPPQALRVDIELGEGGKRFIRIYRGCAYTGGDGT